MEHVGVVLVAIALYLLGMAITTAVYRRRITSDLRAEDMAALALWFIMAAVLICDRGKSNG